MIARMVRWMARPRGSRGSVTPFVLVVSIGFLALAALVIDGGRQLNSKGRAVAYAQAAARAGAQTINVSDERLRLLPAKAVQVAEEYCEQARSNDPQLASCSAETVRKTDSDGSTYVVIAVRAKVEINAIMLSMFGNQTLTASGTAAAKPVSGTSEADAGQIQTLPPPSTRLPGGPGDITAIPSGDPPTSDDPCSVPTTTPPTENDSGDDKGEDGNNDGNNNGDGNNDGNNNGDGNQDGDKGGDDESPPTAPEIPFDPCATDQS